MVPVRFAELERRHSTPVDSAVVSISSSSGGSMHVHPQAPPTAASSIAAIGGASTGNTSSQNRVTIVNASSTSSSNNRTTTSGQAPGDEAPIEPQGQCCKGMLYFNQALYAAGHPPVRGIMPCVAARPSVHTSCSEGSPSDVV